MEIYRTIDGQLFTCRDTFWKHAEQLAADNRLRRFLERSTGSHIKQPPTTERHK